VELFLKGKSVIISGGARGIGQCIAVEFLKERSDVVIADIDEERGRLLEAELCKTFGQGRLKFIRADVTSYDQVHSLFHQTIELRSKVDILVNSHQWWPQAWFKDISDEDWRRCIDINLSSYFLLCREAVRHFIDKRINGKILNMTSQAAFRGATTGHAHYAAAKAGVVGLTMSIARETARHRINVIGLAPGMVETPSTETILKKKRAYYEERIPIGRIAKPEEIAGVAVFLVSERAGYITGATIDISGGMLMR